MPQVYTGEVRNGVVVFDPGTPLPEGTRVRVEPVDRLYTPTSGPVSDQIAGTRTVLLEWARKAEESSKRQAMRFSAVASESTPH
jgi:hypothetical protein